MPDEQSVEQLEARLGELVAERNELLQETSALEEVSQTNAAVKELRQVLDATGGDAEAVKEKLDEYVEGLDNLGAEIREALEDPAVRELAEGVGEGLEQFTEALENVNEALGPLEETLDQIQNAHENAGAPADQQIEALAEAFEFAVDKLGPLIERIPGLGAFFKIYAKAIKHIAVSVGQIQATQRDLQKGWSRLDPGTTMYMVARNEHEIHQGAILELELQRADDRAAPRALSSAARGDSGRRRARGGCLGSQCGAPLWTAAPTDGCAGITGAQRCLARARGSQRAAFTGAGELLRRG